MNVTLFILTFLVKEEGYIPYFNLHRERGSYITFANPSECMIVETFPMLTFIVIEGLI